MSSEGLGKGCVFYFSMKLRPFIEGIEEEKDDINDFGSEEEVIQEIDLE